MCVPKYNLGTRMVNDKGRKVGTKNAKQERARYAEPLLCAFVPMCLFLLLCYSIRFRDLDAQELLTHP